MTHHWTQRDISKTIEDLERQVHELKRHSARASASLGDRTGEQLEELRHRARHAYGDASRNMRWAARCARRQGEQMADVVKENPVTASTVTLAAAGLIGLGVWWLLSSDR